MPEMAFSTLSSNLQAQDSGIDSDDPGTIRCWSQGMTCIMLLRRATCRFSATPRWEREKKRETERKRESQVERVMWERGNERVRHWCKRARKGVGQRQGNTEAERKGESRFSQA